MYSFLKNRPILTLILVLASVELFSFFGYLHPQAGIFLFWMIVAATLSLSLWRLEYGLLIALIELFIGSKGYLFSFDIGEISVSIRIALFLVIMAVWLVKKIKIGNWKLSRRSGLPQLAGEIGGFLNWYLFLFLALFIGLVQAIILRNDYGNIFFDFNAFLYLAYLFPLAEILREKINWERLGKAAIASVSWVAIKTFIIFYVFAHSTWLYTIMVYKWIRDTGVGEITRMDQGFFRIFFQGHIYELLLLITLLGIAGWYFINKENLEAEFSIFNFSRQLREPAAAGKFSKLTWILIINIALSAAVIISFSRSFWVGGAAGLIILFGLMIFRLKAKWRAVAVSSLYLLGIFAAGFVLIIALINVPPRKGKTPSLSSLVSERATVQEAAGQSRMELLGPLFKGIMRHPFLGSGFGATITYNSKDPRVLQNNPTGEYTTFAFEWGYLDLWYKTGILGPLAYLGLIGSILLSLWRAIKNKSEAVLSGISIQAMSLGTITALIALSAVHSFTPYLNHPLGIGFIILSSLFAVFAEKRKIT